MNRIRSRQQFERWLADKPPEVAVALAARAALRVLPLSSMPIRGGPSRNPSSIILPVFRAVATAYCCGMWPDRALDCRAAAIAAVHAADNAGVRASVQSFHSRRSPEEHISRKTDPEIIAATRTSTYAIRASASAARAAGNVDDSTVASSARAAGAAVVAATQADDVQASAALLWGQIEEDAEILEYNHSVNLLMRQPLWTGGIPTAIKTRWLRLKSLLLQLEENWDVWTDWYEDRLHGLDTVGARNAIEELELERIQLSNEHWDGGPSHINGLISELESKYRSNPPAQKAAIIEVEYGEDGRLHRRRPPAPQARTKEQDKRLRDAWSAHSSQLEILDQLDPGRNSPALGHALRHYREALGAQYEELNVIALGVHGARLNAYAERADGILMEDAASEVVGLAAAHGLFIRQFDSWLDYVADASGKPTPDNLAAAIGVAQATREASEIIAEDVSEPLNAIADAVHKDGHEAEGELQAVVNRELLRSVGNVLSGLLSPLVSYARDASSAARKGSISGIEDFTKKATLAVAFGGTAYVLALAAGLPGEFGWVIPVLALLKSKLGRD